MFFWRCCSTLRRHRNEQEMHLLQLFLQIDSTVHSPSIRPSLPMAICNAVLVVLALVPLEKSHRSVANLWHTVLAVLLANGSDIELHMDALIDNVTDRSQFFDYGGAENLLELRNVLCAFDHALFCRFAKNIERRIDDLREKAKKTCRSATDTDSAMAANFVLSNLNLEFISCITHHSSPAKRDIREDAAYSAVVHLIRTDLLAKSSWWTFGKHLNILFAVRRKGVF